ncbi:MAG TPA: sigma-70 family RNA polymerase sigma factor [Bryobacteraceae bacterium]|nr:sigma-70 family RNA polymerase sigma factor [Bryobacteraceae bacterium]
MADAENNAELSWPDPRLVEECLAGNEQAWAALIDRYKKLIYSVPVRWGFSQTDAGDIFQSVVAELLSHLADLREPQALAAWLLQVASHKCRRLKHQQEREQCGENGDIAAEIAIEAAPAQDLLFQDAMREQTLREALIHMPPRCRELIHMLFFENSPRPYAEVAASLGIATGSVGFIRRRCLERLRKYLLEAGFQ